MAIVEFTDKSRIQKMCKLILNIGPTYNVSDINEWSRYFFYNYQRRLHLKYSRYDGTAHSCRNHHDKDDNIGSACQVTNSGSGVKLKI